MHVSNLQCPPFSHSRCSPFDSDMVVNVGVKTIQIEMINLIANYFEGEPRQYYCAYVDSLLSGGKDKKLEVLGELWQRKLARCLTCFIV